MEGFHEIILTRRSEASSLLKVMLFT